jgi:hypothetical protein
METQIALNGTKIAYVSATALAANAHNSFDVPDLVKQTDQSEKSPKRLHQLYEFPESKQAVTRERQP